ncbi:MAG TPA: amino acid adenylation domain-containing protein [Minicystis sp.]|nr:amino acid adenylation domain-containing protein [Minicystis sp.]
MTGPRPLQTGFLRAAERFADRPALEVAGATLSYAALAARASALAATLAREAPAGPPRTAVFAHRSAVAFAGVLGALLRGHAYVPLNPTFPVERTRAMLLRSGARAVVVDAGAEPQIEAVVEGVPGPLLVVAPDCDDAAALAARLPGHRVVGARDLAPASAFAPVDADPDAPAYLLFTSGSTGVPKGVLVAHRNVAAFVDAAVARLAPNERDRFSQLFDFTFDLSAFDLFVAWEVGACVVCPSREAAFMPFVYLDEAKLTVWFSVPSVAAQMERMRMLEPGLYPSLRLSLFCGEALPGRIAAAWSRAAPGSVVENLYGPTEATIACTAYRWDPARSDAESERGIVPIGAPLAGMRARVVDAALEEVAPGEVGELLVAGPQVSLGYLDDPEKTAAAFVVPPGASDVHYRTGDLVRRPRASNEPMQYLGRADQQIKIRGFRVELGEVEAALRELSGAALVAAVGHPRNEGGADGIVAFVAREDADGDELRQALRARLPAYMVPSEVRAVAALPLNANGKVDRAALAALLAAE